MFKNNFKSLIAIATIAFGSAFTAAPANAGNFSLHIGNGYGGAIHFGTGGKRHYNHGYKKPRHVYRSNGYHCGPRHALKRAYNLGLYDPHVARVNHKKIVVKGWNRGYPAKVVFKRTNHGCKIIKARGL